MAKDALLMEKFISTECVRSIRKGWHLCGLVAFAVSLVCNRTLIGQCNISTANGWAPSGNCSPVRLLLGWPSDLKQWRDIRASKIASALCCCVHAWAADRPWLRPGWKILPTRIGYCSNTNGDRRFRYEDNNVAFTKVQPHYYRVRQVEPCHQLGWSSQALILSILALGAMPKQQQQQRMSQPNASGLLLALCAATVCKKLASLGGPTYRATIINI